MNAPGWYCQRCEKPAPELSTDNDADRPLKCPRCKHWSVVWLTPEQYTARLDALRAPTPAVKEALADTALTPEQVKAQRDHAAEHFKQMRAIVEAAPDQS